MGQTCLVAVSLLAMSASVYTLGSITPLFQDEAFAADANRIVSGRSMIQCALMCRLASNCQFINVRKETMACAMIPGDYLIMKHRRKDAERQAMAVLSLCPQSSGEEKYCLPYQATCQDKECLDIYRDCKEAVLANGGNSGLYKMGSSSNKLYGKAQCALSGGNVYITLTHDLPKAVKLFGKEERGSNFVLIKYDLPMAYILPLIDKAISCKQRTEAQCLHTAFLMQGYAWLTGRNNTKLNYWGGGDPKIGGCSCGITNTCFNKVYRCNCDANDHTVRYDGGNITVKQDLPITGGYFGDAEGPNEYVVFTLGNLYCTL